MFATIFNMLAVVTAQQPSDYKAQLQALLLFDLDKLLSRSPTGEFDPEWTALLQAFWQILSQEAES